MNGERFVGPGQAYASIGPRLATGLVEISSDPAVLDGRGFWVVVGTFEGAWTCARFAHVQDTPPTPAPVPWPGVDSASWTSSLDRGAYLSGVSTIRELIARGEVYQVNLCRVLDVPLAERADLEGLARVVSAGNPAKHSARVHLPEVDVDVVSASPELFLSRQGARIASAPIKGTGRTRDDLASKDIAENVMIVDLVRNDLGRVCRTGTITAEEMLTVEQHPGLVHLVSTVRGELAPGVTWPLILAASFPPGSVSGAPKSTALQAIGLLETEPRGPYCGAIGWVDADRQRAELSVGIRTFWRHEHRLRFGTGAGITWGSDPLGEWKETELKAQRLLGLAAADRRTS